MAGRRYTRGEREKGILDENFEPLKNLSFLPNIKDLEKKKTKSCSRPSSPCQTFPSLTIGAISTSVESFGPFFFEYPTFAIYITQYGCQPTMGVEYRPIESWSQPYSIA